jgi:hypothetical protein
MTLDKCKCHLSNWGEPRETSGWPSQAEYWNLQLVSVLPVHLSGRYLRI